jgi:importin subunit alpha-1
MAGENSRIRDHIINCGAIDPIAKILMRNDITSEFTRNASWTLANLCRGKPGPPFESIKHAIPALAHVFINNDEEEIITDILWSFSYISDGHD